MKRVVHDSAEKGFSGRQRAENELTRSYVPWKLVFGPFVLRHPLYRS